MTPGFYVRTSHVAQDKELRLYTVLELLTNSQLITEMIRFFSSYYSFIFYWLSLGYLMP